MNNSGTLSKDHYRNTMPTGVKRSETSKTTSIPAAYTYIDKTYIANMYGLLTKCGVEMAGYWPSSFFACLWTETEQSRGPP